MSLIAIVKVSHQHLGFYRIMMMDYLHKSLCDAQFWHVSAAYLACHIVVVRDVVQWSACRECIQHPTQTRTLLQFY